MLNVVVVESYKNQQTVSTHECELNSDLLFSINLYYLYLTLHIYNLFIDSVFYELHSWKVTTFLYPDHYS